MTTKEFILNHLNITNVVVFWLFMMVIAFVVDVICLRIMSFWSLFLYIDFEDILNKGPSKYQITKYFLWPIFIPGKIIATISFFFEYKRYEYDEKEEQRLLKEIEELEEKIKKKNQS